MVFCLLPKLFLLTVRKICYSNQEKPDLRKTFEIINWMMKAENLQKF